MLTTCLMLLLTAKLHSLRTTVSVSARFIRLLTMICYSLILILCVHGLSIGRLNSTQRNLSCLGYHVSANLLNIPIASLMLLLVSLTLIKIWAWSLVTTLSGPSILPTVHLRPTACWDSFVGTVPRWRMFLLGGSFILRLLDLTFPTPARSGHLKALDATLPSQREFKEGPQTSFCVTMNYLTAFAL